MPPLPTSTDVLRLNIDSTAYRRSRHDVGSETALRLYVGGHVAESGPVAPVNTAPFHVIDRNTVDLSYIGYKPVDLASKADMGDIQLEIEAQMLKDVVVVSAAIAAAHMSQIAPAKRSSLFIIIMTWFEMLINVSVFSILT